MKTKAILQVTATLAIAAVSFSTSSVRAESTQSASALAVDGILKPPGDFTWMEFGQAVCWGAATGSLAGAVAGAVVGAPTGAGWGALGGLVGEAVKAGVDYAIGGEGATAMSVPVRALD